jgi:SAM-dependent methyltransferase
MSFSVGADAYDRFMGRYSIPLAPVFADFARLAPGERVLDVGCGPGALTTELVRRLGPTAVAAVDPSATFVAAAQERHPLVEVQRASAELLPFDDRTFDAALAQLVVHFMADPVAGVREMRRVTRPGGTIAACVWDFVTGGGPLSLFWRAAHEIDPDVDDESTLVGAADGQLAALFVDAGLTDVEGTSITVDVEHQTFDEWWDPFTLGVGPAGAYLARLTPDDRTALHARCRDLQPGEPFVVSARAWTARGHA